MKKYNIYLTLIVFIILLTPTKIYAAKNLEIGEEQKKTIVIITATIALIGYFYIVIFNKKDE